MTRFCPGARGGSGGDSGDGGDGGDEGGSDGGGGDGGGSGGDGGDGGGDGGDGGDGGKGGDGGGAGACHAQLAPLTAQRTYSTYPPLGSVPGDSGVLQAPLNQSEQYDRSSGCSKPLQLLAATHLSAHSAAAQGASAALWSKELFGEYAHEVEG